MNSNRYIGEALHQGRYLDHYGIPRRSGRYPWGSGKNPQRARNLYNVYRQLHKEGFTDAQIAEQWGMSQTKLTSLRSIGKDAEKNYQRARAERLLERCGGNQSEVARRMGIRESTLRSLLDPKRVANGKRTDIAVNTLKEFADKYKYVDVGEGTEIALDIKKDRMNTALLALKQQGYNTHNVYADQMGNNYQTTMKCLVPPGVDYQELRAHMTDIKPVSDIVIDADGNRKPGKEPYTNIDSSRVAVNYAETGGDEKDGLMMIRRGCKDLSLGRANYAQVRIAVGGTHYLKGMAVYGDDEDFKGYPKGTDIIFNTNKHVGTPMMGPEKNTVLKPQKTGEKEMNPFGAALKENPEDLRMIQKYYTDDDGTTKRSAINVVNEEGNWDEWRKSLSSQFLSKQSVPLAKSLLNLKEKQKQLEFDEIKSLTNNTVKKVLLEEFASSCDAAAEDLKAAALPGQAAHVLIPCPSLKENEIYAPKYKDGTHVCLVRFPHESISQIPELIVNNKNAEAIKMLSTHPTDAVAINKAAADRMSGADFDGDTALVIPANNPGGKVKINTAPQFKGLIGYDPKEAYPLTDEQIDENPKLFMTKKEKGKQMGITANLINDMTLKGADKNPDEMVRVIKHSMCVIDANKHKLDWRRSYEENGIEELKKKYQQREEIDPKTGEHKYGGAGTITSRAKSEERVLARKAISGISKLNTDPETGERIDRLLDEKKLIKEKLSVKVSDGSRRQMNVYYDKDTGKPYTMDPFTKERVYRTEAEMAKVKTKYKMEATTKMAVTKDAFDLTSGGSRENPGHPIEGVYANFANQMKQLANDARKEYLNTPNLKVTPEGKAKYKKERDELLQAVLVAKSNAPKERQAVRLANAEVALLKEENPDIDYEHLKKARGQAITRARNIVGAKKTRINPTPEQWEAIQNGGIAHSTLLEILRNADMEKIKKLAMPKQEKNTLSASQIAVIKAMADKATQTQIAERFGVSVSVISKAINS